MKPLELVVYRTLEDFGVVFGYDTPDVHATSEADAMAAAKRFTDTELAAEVWRARWTKVFAESYRDKLTVRQESMVDTMERFATLPHYDEVTA